MAGRPTLGSMYAGEGSRLGKREGPVQKTRGCLTYHIGDRPVWLISNKLSSGEALVLEGRVLKPGPLVRLMKGSA